MLMEDDGKVSPLCGKGNSATRCTGNFRQPRFLLRPRNRLRSCTTCMRMKTGWRNIPGIGRRVAGRLLRGRGWSRWIIGRSRRVEKTEERKPKTHPYKPRLGHPFCDIEQHPFRGYLAYCWWTPMKNLLCALLTLLLIAPLTRAQEPAAQSAVSAAKAAKLAWQPWSDAVFAQAKREKRFVLLDLEAVWCHWCHVMDENTYSDPAVIKILREHYIVVKADQDARPDLSNRYEDYGWPATVVFNGDGQEIVKRQGYLAPDEMLSILKAIVADPTPGPSVRPEAKLELPANGLLSDALRQRLNKDYRAGYDDKYGSWGTDQKFLDWDSVEYSMVLARLNKDAQAEHMARQTLTEQLHLLDPAWGGVYQYSTDGDWNHPHFEKIMQMQAENLRAYSLGYAQFHDEAYLHAAEEIRRYLKTFLTSPQGAFYTSQDADLVEGHHSGEYFALDDAARRKQGVPHVDKHMYARENGWAINALVAFYDATDDASALADASKAAQWVLANRALPGGG